MHRKRQWATLPSMPLVIGGLVNAGVQANAISMSTKTVSFAPSQARNSLARNVVRLTNIILLVSNQAPRSKLLRGACVWSKL